MSDLASILGEDLGDCLDFLGDDVAPTESEAVAQNRRIIARRRLKRLVALQKRNPNDPELGNVFKTLGKIVTAPVRMTGQLLTGNVKGALKTAIDPGGFKKAKKVVAAVTHPAATVKKAVSGALHTAEHAAVHAAAPAISAAAHIGAAATMPEIKIRCIPCDSNTAVASDVAKKVVPEMARIQKLLGKMDTQTQVTSEHNRLKKQAKWRKQVLRLLKTIQEKRCHA